MYPTIKIHRHNFPPKYYLSEINKIKNFVSGQSLAERILADIITKREEYYGRTRSRRLAP